MAKDLIPNKTAKNHPKVMVIFGTRPEAIKLAPVIRVFEDSRSADLRIVVTAQHRQMLDQVLETFGIRPHVDLDLMQPNQTLASFTARALVELDHVYEREKPALVLVQGDTTTVLAASLGAFYRGIPVGHVEAGLRTFNPKAPWPEEANRVLTSHLADLHFAPTSQSRLNLLAERVPPENIHVTGNTAIDALLLARQILASRPAPVPGLPERLLEGQRFVLITGHRRENFGNGFLGICQGIAVLASSYPEVHFIYPVHLNPNVQEPVKSILGQNRHPNVHLLEPLGYLPFVRLMLASQVILTDSGGIQEEAPTLGKPVFVMRDTTERPEAVQAGAARLVGTDPGRICREVSRVLDSPREYDAMARAGNPFGDGTAARAIHDISLGFLSSLNTANG
jgi:UDP-N-acetylglucosamine 2-epimerase (non-hydrolysing)